MQHNYICQRILIEDCVMELNEVEKKLTQTQRREKTRALLLSSACRLFGEGGYEATSLEDIADDSGLTIRPIYYHFGSKQALFRAVNDFMEQQAMQALACRSAVEAWKQFEKLCEAPDFRQVILVDAPNVLGRERWNDVWSLPWCEGLSPQMSGGRTDMPARVALAALSEAAMVVAETGNDSAAREAANQLIATLIPEPGMKSQPADAVQGR